MRKKKREFGKIKLLVTDFPFSFDDKLQMNDEVRRSADDQYAVLDIEKLKTLPIDKICAENAVLVFWVPATLLQEGLDCIKEYGFKFKQIINWNKLKKEPLGELKEDIKTHFKSKEIDIDSLFKIIDSFDLTRTLGFGMGHLFRAANEIALVAVRGKIYKELKNRSQRNVIFDINYKHSQKPEILQDKLDLMFPDIKENEKMELFARRKRQGWICLGNEIENQAGVKGEDIFTSLKNYI